MLENRRPLRASEILKNVRANGEGDFAFICIAQGLDVYCGIPVGDRVIDFWVEDPSTGQGELVEVTYFSKKFFVGVPFGTVPKGSIELTSQVEHKWKQIQAMIDSGLPWRVEYMEDIRQKWENLNMNELMLELAKDPEYVMLANLKEENDIPSLSARQSSPKRSPLNDQDRP